MTYIHLFEAAEKIAEMQWPDTVTDSEAFKIIESSFGAIFPAPGTDNLLAVRALTASGYRAEINRLLNAGKLIFYDPLTRLKINCNDASDPLLKLDELQALLDMELVTSQQSIPTTKAEAAPVNQDGAFTDKFPSSKTIQKIPYRRNALDPAIDKAIELAGNMNLADVYLKLRDLSLNEEKPFTGVNVGGALCYTDDSDQPAKLTKEALGKRLNKRR